MSLARSFLFIPGTDAQKLAKGLAAGAEAVIFDLEDAVAASRKEEARAALEQYAAAPFAAAFSGFANIYVRINGTGTPYWSEDLRSCFRMGISRIMLPKTEGKDDIRRILEAWNRLALTGGQTGDRVNDCNRLRDLGRDNACDRRHDRTDARAGERTPLQVLPLIETAHGVEHAYEIASADPSVAGLALGAVDLALDLGIRLSREQDELLYTRSRLVIASRAARLPGPVDAVHLRIDDHEGLLAESIRARNLGFSGKLAIHPKQIAAVHQAWRHDDNTAAEEKDRRIVSAFQQAEKTGTAAILVDGELVDYPVYRAALQRLNRPDERR